jgi:hypothetical protein
MNQLTQSEQELLKKLNIRAMVIVQLEETLKSKKVPVDINVLHELETKDLIEMLENWSDENQDKERLNYLK